MEKNPRKLLSLVALIYFPFIINFLIDDSQQDYNLSDDDVKFIKTYQKAWYFLIAWTIITVILFMLSFYYNIYLLNAITNILVIFFIIYVFVNIFVIFSDKPAILFTNNDVKKLNINKVGSWNVFYILSYLPFVNFYLYSWKNYTQEQEYWLKESSLLYFIWAFVWILSMFFAWFIGLFYFILFFVIVRSVSLFFGIDFIPDSIKNLVYISYEDNPLEILSYFCAFIHYIFYSLYLLLKWKKLDNYWKYLYKVKINIKQTYELNSILKKPKKYLYLFLSYVVFILIFVYLAYQSWYSFYTFVYLFSLIIFLSYIVIVYYNHKKIVFLPVITPSIFIILKQFR